MNKDANSIFIQSMVDELMREYMPNVSLEFIYRFNIIKKRGLFQDYRFLNKIFRFINVYRYYLIIEFIDGNYTKVKISYERNEEIKQNLKQMNRFISNYRMLNYVEY